MLYMDTKSNHIGKNIIHGFGNTEGKPKKTSLFTPLYGNTVLYTYIRMNLEINTITPTNTIHKTKTHINV